MLTIHAGGGDHSNDDDKMTMTVMKTKWKTQLGGRTKFITRLTTK